MLLCTRRLEWDALHRVPGHESQCAAWHGHRYVAEIGCHAEALDAQGRIIDFGVVKQVVGGWIDTHWDHTALLMRGDPDPAAQAIADSNAARGRPVYWFDDPPTAEVIVAELARVAQALLTPHGVAIRQIRLWETPNGSATWTADR
jgi:6-pyruvoyltetrahydropterin/6-carboxytetrahydropterin synthase